MITMKYTALVTIAAVIYTFLLSARVGGARAKLGVDAPAMSGQPDFDKTFRIHMNTVEQLVLFVPVLWLAAADSSAARQSSETSSPTRRPLPS